MQSISNFFFFFLFKDNQGGYGSVGRMGMGNNYSGGYGTPDGLGGYGKWLQWFDLLVSMCVDTSKFMYYLQ